MSPVGEITASKTTEDAPLGLFERYLSRYDVEREG